MRSSVCVYIYIYIYIDTYVYTRMTVNLLSYLEYARGAAGPLIKL